MLTFFWEGGGCGGGGGGALCMGHGAHSKKKKDANHILIPQLICFFHICIKTVIILVQI